MKRQERKAWFAYEGYVELGVGKSRASTLNVWGYEKGEDFTCRLEISRAGIAVYTGRKGNKLLDDFSWKGFIERLEAGAKK